MARPISDLGELLDQLGASVAATLDARPRTGSICLIIPLADPPEYALVFNEQTLSSRRRFHVLGMMPALSDMLERESRIELAQMDLATWFHADPADAALDSHGEIQTNILTKVRLDDDRSLVLRVALSADHPPPRPEQLDQLAEIAREAAPLADALARLEHQERRAEEVARTNELMLSSLLAPDRAALFDHLSETINRQFGFGQFYLALVHEPSRTFKCELHTGFDAEFAPFSTPLARTDDYFVRLVETGRVHYYTAEPEEAEALRVLTGSDFTQRAVVAPLKVGSRPLGFIFAAHPRNDDLFALREAFEQYVRLASVAIENFQVRTQTERRAETDSLTGVYNRHFLDRVLEVEIPRVKRYNIPISMLMLDLCDFKATNDTYGHVFGDHILRETASLIQATMRDSDIVVRYGGDEFVVLMVNTAPDQAERVRVRIEQAFIDRNRTQSEERMMIDISVGLCSADGETISGLLEEADRAMYVNKNERRKRQLAEALLNASGSKREAIDSVIASLLANLNKKEPRNTHRSYRLAYLTLFMARHLGLSASDCHSLAIAAMLHDVGKASLPTELLQRRGALNEAEMKAVRAHATMGEEFIRGIACLEQARPMIRHHHERFDGATDGPFPGYPHGLAGGQIPLGARILKLADCTESIASDKPYRPAISLEETLKIVKDESGGAFDPKLVNILLNDDRWTLSWDSHEALIELYGKLVRELEPAEAEGEAAEIEST